ncbi:MAG: hypothetical protein AB7T74_06775 [Clostridia bacterium]|jgi:hypothetical protein
MQAKNQVTTKTLSLFFRIVLLGAMLCASVGMASAEEFNSSKGFFIDLPEGFVFMEGDGSSRFSFTLGAMSVDLLVSEPGRHSSARAAAEDTAKRLGSRMTPASFKYAGLDAAVAEFSFGSGQTSRRGMAFFLDGQAGKASSQSSSQSTSQSGTMAETAYDLTLLAHAPAADWQRDRELLLSCIDGFSASAAGRSAPGPLGTLARSRLKPSDRQARTIQFGDDELSVSWNPKEAALAQELVEREYRVLEMTAATPAAVEAGMQRFYRMVWRDSLPSLDQLGLSLSRAWESGTTIKPADDASSGPRFGPPADPRGYAQALLKWTQGFNYERDPEGSDVVNPLSAAFEQRGDCDSRILVLNILLRRENIESILMISLKHEHALLAVDAPGIGARYPYGGRQWLVGETTAPVDIGRIDARQANPADWFALDFPF